MSADCLMTLCLPIFSVISVGLGFGFPECESKMFPGFRSRCTIPFTFNAFIAHAVQTDTHAHRQTCRLHCTGSLAKNNVKHDRFKRTQSLSIATLRSRPIIIKFM